MGKKRYKPEPPRTIIRSWEKRNMCPYCGSDFVVIGELIAISSTRVKNTLECSDCGRHFSHIYRLVYKFSELSGEGS